jgi:OOP family OmpA-OmpF porin
VDTVKIYVAPPPPPPHRCEHGIAPSGVKMDSYGCIVLTDTLLLEDIHFAFDKSDLSARADSILDRVAESMIAHPEVVYFEIAGHTDSVGTFAYNYLLSARRAAAVRNELILEGVPAWRLSAVGFGEGFPIAPNATVEGRALNRRGTQIRVIKKQ